MKKENSVIDSILVQDFNGHQVDLIQKYNSKFLLILIYHNQCLGCTGRAIPLAYNFQKKHDGIQVIGIHTNPRKVNITEEEIKSIFTIDEIPFPIYIDIGSQVYHQFQSEGTPQWVLVNKNGVVQRSIFGSQENSVTKHSTYSHT